MLFAINPQGIAFALGTRAAPVTLIVFPISALVTTGSHSSNVDGSTPES